MISKAQVKHIRSLEDKKIRQQHGEFVVEGEKMLNELLASAYQVHAVFALSEWIGEHMELASQFPVHEIAPHELQRISLLQTPNKVLALVKIPGNSAVPDRRALVLDGIQDPGNLGSIIRCADWFGIPRVYCSADTVDVYNPKVVQGSMGSIFRVACEYTDLETLLSSKPTGLDAYACVLDGRSIDAFSKTSEGWIVIGNESKGIRAAIQSLCSHRLSIPRKGGAESLNAAVATGIICHTLLS